MSVLKLYKKIIRLYAYILDFREVRTFLKTILFTKDFSISVGWTDYEVGFLL